MSVLSSEGFIVLTPPSMEPITLSDVKDWLNIDFTSKDTLIAKLMTRARRRCEPITGRAFATQQIQATMPIMRPQGFERANHPRTGLVPVSRTIGRESIWRVDVLL